MEKIVNLLKKDPFNFVNNLQTSEIEEIIMYANDKYYNTETPVISDAIYDLLVDFLRHKDPKNKILKIIGSSVKSKDKVKLDYHLGSMDKIKPPSPRFERWIKKYNPPYILTEKLDGISALLVYRYNGNINLYTRGTSTHGLDITPILKYLTKIPSFNRMKKYVEKNKTILMKTKSEKNLIAFRGELILKKITFETNWKDKMKNARNAISGLVNSKNINPKLAGDTNLVLYEIVDPFLKLQQQLNIISDLDFYKVHNKTLTISKKLSFEYLSKYFEKRRKFSKYEIDGIIVSNNELHKRNKSGNPEYTFAFKSVLEDQKAITTVKDIKWKYSKDGYINPVIIVDPVEISGVTVKRIYVYNAKFVVDNKLGKGAKIELIRSGDVIPKVNKIIKKANKVDLPKGNWKWTDTKVDIVAKSLENNREIEIKNIYYFFSSLDAKGLGEKTIEKIYDSGLVTIKDFIVANKSDFLKIDGFQEKSSDNLVKSIKKSLINVDLPVLMSASNKLGHGIGIERSKTIVNKYPNILTNKWNKIEFIEKIKEMPGWDDITSKLFVNNFPKFLIFYESIKNHITLSKTFIKKNITKNSKLNGKVLVLSGFRDKELEKTLKQFDIKITNSISKNTDLLVVKNKSVIEDNTTKVQKAKELEIDIIDRDDLIKML